MSEREKREFWVAHEGRVLKVEGWRCTPENPDYWWVPHIGYSIPSTECFVSREVAVEVARDWILSERIYLDELTRELGIVR